MLIVFGVCGLAVGVSTALAVWKVAGFEKLAMAVKEFSWLFVEGGLKWTDLALLALVLFLCWSLVIMVGFLAVIISRTLLVKSRFARFPGCSTVLRYKYSDRAALCSDQPVPPDSILYPG